MGREAIVGSSAPYIKYTSDGVNWVSVVVTDVDGNLQANVIPRVGSLASLLTLAGANGEIAVANDSQSLVVQFPQGTKAIGGIAPANIATGVAGLFPAGDTAYTFPVGGNAVYADLAALITYLHSCEYANGSKVSIYLPAGIHSGFTVNRDLRHVVLSGANAMTVPISSVSAVDGTAKTITLVYAGTSDPMVGGALGFSDDTTAEAAKLIGAHKVLSVNTAAKTVTLSFSGPTLPVIAALAVNSTSIRTSISGAVTVNSAHMPIVDRGVAFAGAVALYAGSEMRVSHFNASQLAFFATVNVASGSSFTSSSGHCYFGSGANLVVNGNFYSDNIHFGGGDAAGFTGIEVNQDATLAGSVINISNIGASDFCAQVYNGNISALLLGMYHIPAGIVLVGTARAKIEALYNPTGTAFNLLVDNALVPIARNRLYPGGFVAQVITDIPSELPIIKQVAPAAKTVTATLTADEVLTRVIQANPGGAAAATYTMPTGTNMQAALGVDFAVDDAFEFTVNNISTAATETVTMAGNTGMTAIGSMTIAANSAVATNSVALFRVRKTGNNAFSFMKVA
jgi:hypothetical protein